MDDEMEPKNQEGEPSAKGKEARSKPEPAPGLHYPPSAEGDPKEANSQATDTSDNSPNLGWPRRIRAIIRPFVTYLDKHDGAVTAAATTIIAALTVFLAFDSHQTGETSHNEWSEMKTANKIGRDALVIANRPYISLQSAIWRMTPQGVEFIPEWENTGASPTQGMAEWVNYQFTDAPLPTGFSNVDTRPTDNYGIVPLAPRAKQKETFFNIPLTCISTLAADGKHALYVWGWAKYSDTLTKSQHVTKFCWLVRTAVWRDTFAGSTADVSYSLCAEGNCMDDECKDDGGRPHLPPELTCSVETTPPRDPPTQGALPGDKAH